MPTPGATWHSLATLLGALLAQPATRQPGFARQLSSGCTTKLLVIDAVWFLGCPAATCLRDGDMLLLLLLLLLLVVVLLLAASHAFWWQSSSSCLSHTHV